MSILRRRVPSVSKPKIRASSGGWLASTRIGCPPAQKHPAVEIQRSTCTECFSGRTVGALRAVALVVAHRHAPVAIHAPLAEQRDARRVSRVHPFRVPRLPDVDQAVAGPAGRGDALGSKALGVVAVRPRLPALPPAVAEQPGATIHAVELREHVDGLH